MPTPTDNSNIDAAVLGEINQRTLVNGTAIETGPIAEQLGISADQLSESLNRLRGRALIGLEGGTPATITPEGHAGS